MADILVDDGIRLPALKIAGKPSISFGGSVPSGGNSGTGVSGDYTSMSHVVSGSEVMAVTASGVAVIGQLSAVLVGLVAGTNVAISASDTLLQALAKLQAQIDAL